MGKLKGSWLCAHLQSTVSPEFVCVAMHRVGICLAGTKYVMDFLVSAPSEGQCKKLASEEQQVSTETLCLGKNSALILPEDEHQSQGRNCIDKTLFETLPVQNYICSCYKEHKNWKGSLWKHFCPCSVPLFFLFRRQTELKSCRVQWDTQNITGLFLGWDAHLRKGIKNSVLLYF